MRKFMTLHGGRYDCRQNYVTVTSCVKEKEVLLGATYLLPYLYLSKYLVHHKCFTMNYTPMQILPRLWTKPRHHHDNID